MQHEYSTDDVAETERTLCSLFFKLVVSHQRRDEESCRKPKSEVSESCGRWRHRRQRPPKTLKIVRATHGSVGLVPLRNVHVQEKLTCLHVITENLHPYNPIWGQCKALHHVVGYDPHFAAPQLLAQNLALPEVAGGALPAKD